MGVCFSKMGICFSKMRVEFYVNGSLLMKIKQFGFINWVDKVNWPP